MKMTLLPALVYLGRQRSCVIRTQLKWPSACKNTDQGSSVSASIQRSPALRDNIVGKIVLGLHAMIVIGYRQEGNGDFVFLLQNWWRDRCLIEVSEFEAYLAQSGATCAFVTADWDLQTIPANLPTVDAPYAETEADTGERLPLEM